MNTIVAKVRAAGVVGAGGAGFPTHVKLTANPDKPISHLLVNGCECEPYLTADYRVMLEAPAPIVTGASGFIDRTYPATRLPNFW